MVQALRMKPKEMETRMKKMRSHLQSHNVFRWGADMVSQLIKLDAAKHP
jgi:trehalose-6-phosphate synthase